MLMGLCFLPAAFGQHPDVSILQAGICLFTLGALIAAIGTYLKARALQSSAASQATAKPQPKRTSSNSLPRSPGAPLRKLLE